MVVFTVYRVSSGPSLGLVRVLFGVLFRVEFKVEFRFEFRFEFLVLVLGICSRV